jgi:site-specific DNA-methyltransferase (adenine-specific)
MDGLREMPDNYVDLAIIDPPYGIGCVNQKRSRKFYDGRMKWNDAAPTKEYFNEILRVSKNRIIWGINYYASMIPDMGRIVHVKDPHGYQFKELSTCDIASHSFGVNCKTFIYEWRGNVQGGKMNVKNIGTDARIHPTQKPVALYKWLLQNYAKEGDLILDTHMGSGSSYIACLDMGFDYIGYEIDQDYFTAIEKRVYDFTRQTNLFEV